MPTRPVRARCDGPFECPMCVPYLKPFCRFCLWSGVVLCRPAKIARVWYLPGWRFVRSRCPRKDCWFEGGRWEDCIKVRLQGPNLAITHAVHDIPRGLNPGYPRSPGQEHPPERKTLTAACSDDRLYHFQPIHSAVRRHASNFKPQASPFSLVHIQFLRSLLPFAGPRPIHKALNISIFRTISICTV